MSRIELIGIDAPELSAEQRQLLRNCVAVVASRRHRPLVEPCPAELIDITPLEAMLQRIEGVLERGPVAVLASGDPLFYGIGRTLIERFGPERLVVHPALSAVQLACGRFKVPWDDLPLISLHGRSVVHPAGLILRHQRSLLFTDSRHSPDRLAADLLATLEDCGDNERISRIRLRVAENLGLDDERITQGTLAEIARARFAPLNMVLVEQPPLPDGCRLGLCENDIRHSRGLITKDEIRAVTLHQLRLPETGVLWDIGGGSGSVSLEASRLCPELAIFTIEKKAEEQDNILANIRRFGAYSIQLIRGEAPGALDQLPAPDRIFVGGGGKTLEAILRAAVPRLQPGGRIVVNTVLAESTTTALHTLEQLGLRVASTTLSVTRNPSADGTPRTLNPITLITGEP
ncbi:MAG: precorrin-6y C5,15-methyltransferase (decarboxylating) subunit CbiE [Desulfobulbus sp.]|jgi:precorrin-6Y C5,15-methyltransferase (decarboxylating)